MFHLEAEDVGQGQVQHHESKDCNLDGLGLYSKCLNDALKERLRLIKGQCEAGKWQRVHAGLQYFLIIRKQSNKQWECEVEADA